MEYVCPNCKERLQIPDEYAGKNGRCRKCNHSFQVPSFVEQDFVASPVQETHETSKVPKLLSISAIIVVLVAIAFAVGSLSSTDEEFKTQSASEEAERTRIQAVIQDQQEAVASESRRPSPSPENAVPGEDPLSFEVVVQNRLEKGGSLDPLLAPQYVLFVVEAALNEGDSELSEPKVRATLRALLDEVRDEARRRGEQIDGVSAHLYLSRDHIAGDDMRLGTAEWWPKGHSFNPDNVANIKNKATYVEEIDVFSLPKPAETVVQRLSEDLRRTIFAELVRSQDRAMREAEAKYPTDGSNIPISELRTYDFDTAIRKKLEMMDELGPKYERELLQRHGITKQELDDISEEAMNKQWPLPAY